MILYSQVFMGRHPPGIRSMGSTRKCSTVSSCSCRGRPRVVRCSKQPESQFMPKKILLANDSITIQKVVELTFSDGDYEVIAVNNGAKAIQKLAEMRPDIILSDIIMPEKNGYEVCEYVK